MNRFFLAVCLAGVVVLWPAKSLYCHTNTLFDPVSYVDPFIGTTHSPHPANWESHGRIYPGAVVPFGMIQLSPETSVDYSRGYDYNDSSIYYFSCAGHASGYPHGSAGSIYVMPVDEPAGFSAGEYSRRRSHENEFAEPGYYRVKFDDDGTLVEASALVRTAMFKFTFEAGVRPVVYLGRMGELRLLTNRLIQGAAYHARLEFSSEYQVISDTGDGVLLEFEKQKSGKTIILIKMSLSHTSHDGSEKNMIAEHAGWDFDLMRHESRSMWEKALSAIQVHDSNHNNKVKFYTALYRSLLIPWIISDADGQYTGQDGQVHVASGTNQYGLFSPWDTFRSLHPLLTIIEPERQRDMILSALDVYRQGGALPRGPMTGNHIVPIIVDAYFKGITDFDTGLAYQAMREILLDRPASAAEARYRRREEIAVYDSLGYLPNRVPESVTKTVEYAYNDWVLAQFARDVVHQKDDYVYLKNRSKNYRNLYYGHEGFLLPREGDHFVTDPGHAGYKEGDQWVYSLFVPHNVQDIINLIGGHDAFVGFLDNAFDTGRFIFDNEPMFHIPYLYSYARAPEKTQRRLSDIMETLFTTEPGGLPGNDDLGSLSSWFVFSAMGFFPVCPGQPVYNIGIPLFDSIVLHTAGQRTFEIVCRGRTRNATDRNARFIGAAWLNGAPLHNSWFSHEDMAQGGSLIFDFSVSETTDWATSFANAAPSLTTETPAFSISDLALSAPDANPGDTVYLRYSLSNHGEAGTAILRVNTGSAYDSGEHRVFLNSFDAISDSLPFRLFNPGVQKLWLAGFEADSLVVIVRDDSLRMQINYSRLQCHMTVEKDSSQEVSFVVENAGGHKESFNPEIHIQGETHFLDMIQLDPGEIRQVKYAFVAADEGVFQVKAGNELCRYKVYAHDIQASILDISTFIRPENLVIKAGADGWLQQDAKNAAIDHNTVMLKDFSGLENHADIMGIDQGSIEFGRHLAFNDSRFLVARISGNQPRQSDHITMIAWVFHEEMARSYVSIITQGDYHVMQVRPERKLAFFTKGWGRGECHARLPENWLGQWHHIAGVWHGDTLEIYINGVQQAKRKVSKSALIKGSESWHIGRNEEFPGQRIFHGKIDGIRIFNASLNADDIMHIMVNDMREMPVFSGE